MLVLTVGETRISVVVEAPVTFPCDFLLPDATAAEVRAIDWLKPPFADADGGLTLWVQAFVIEAAGRRIVVDTCVGNDKPRSAPALDRLNTDFLQRFEAAGFARDTIDIVLCTHLHVDHVGWNTMLVEGRWAPTFPNARYLIGATEYAHLRGQNIGDDQQILVDSVQPLIDHGLVDLVATDHEICAGIRLVPTPGHTPGHVSVSIEANGERALLTGDFVHNPAQIARPDWSSFADHDQRTAEATRRGILASVADQPVMLIGTHFPAPTGGRVERAGTGYRFVS